MQSTQSTLDRIKRWVLYSVLGVVAVAALAYGGDWAVLQVRAARGTAFGSVVVDRFMVTPLKGGKAEYDYLGQEEVTCSKSLFPQLGHQPCWYLEKHKNDNQLN